MNQGKGKTEKKIPSPQPLTSKWKVSSDVRAQDAVSALSEVYGIEEKGDQMKSID